MGKKQKVPASRFRFALLIAALALVAAVLIGGLAGQSFLASPGVRYISLGVLFFCLGLNLRARYMKVLALAGFALFTALAVNEIYRPGNLAGPLAEKTDVKTAPKIAAPEFYDEVQNSVAPASLSIFELSAQNDLNFGRGNIIADLQQARDYFSALGFAVSDRAITTAYAYDPDPKLGYHGRKGPSQVLALKRHNNETVFAAVYHYNDEGWRITPRHPEAREAVVFLGGSFTFGVGLSDEDSYPYKVAQALGPDYQVFNFGEAGYGAHQALAIIESGRLEDIAGRYEKVHVFYLSKPEHKERNSGLAPWDKNGPSYQLSADGGVEYQGSFTEAKKNGPGENNLNAQAALGDEFLQDLHLGIIRQADRILKTNYKTGLTVLDAYPSEDYMRALTEDGIPLLVMLPAPGPEHAIPNDGHPSALATTIYADRIAAYLRANK